MDKEDLGGSGSNNSSDFVRKLYKMLEDPTYESVVRWGNEGDSFVVLENEKFTKSILPKHFKHSNFASFVRQLNKYDFHKVRQSNEDSGQNPYGQGAWEFKHPEFQANKKDSLDNIRRKAPAPRKSNATIDESLPSQRIDLVNTQLVATQHQLQNLQDRYDELANGHVILLQQVVQLQKIVKNHDGAMHRVMGFLHSVDAQRRSSRAAGFANGHGIGIADLVGSAPNDHPASPLQQASQLLGEFSTENLFSKDLEQMQAGFNYRSEFSTPSNDHSSTAAVSQAPTNVAVVANNIPYATTNYDLDSMVYPVGQVNGIDPINSEHIHNIPYAIPPSGPLPLPSDNPADMEQSKSTAADRKKSYTDPGWGMHKPRILLVEDDKTCARVGSKFLQSFQCGVDIAHHGLEAVNKMNAAPNSFDLILMDIIMPHLDGISATVCIREIAPTIPIIAMTSNIRADDIEMYFRYGMNDVLPKPFTKEGMLRNLEKHLMQFKKNYVHPSSQPQSAVYPGYNATMPINQQPIDMSIAQISTTQSIKDENSPTKSPASSWHSPNQIAGQPSNTTGQASFTQMTSNAAYAITPAHPHAVFPQQPQAAAMPAPSQAGHRRVISDMPDMTAQDDHPDKRQRMYPPPQPGRYPQ